MIINQLMSVKRSAYLYLTIFLLNTVPVVAQISPATRLNDVRSFEVSACSPSKNKLISVWMEKRPERKDDNPDAQDMRVAYKFSSDNGKSWTNKGIVDSPDTFGTGNPFVTADERGDAYLVCMHIGNDFYSGNISLYQFDYKTKDFKLKSVPFKSDSQLLDKPAIVSFGNEIHLVYVAYNKKGPNAVKYQMSADDGKTWSIPVNVFPEVNTSFLGPSITRVNGKGVIVSSGAYGRGDVIIATRKVGVDSIAFNKPVAVCKLSGSVGAAMTEISSFDDKLIITWQPPHQRGETWMSFSTNKGETWAAPYMICKKGNLLSSVFDKEGNIHAIYTDFGNNKFVVKYNQMNQQYEELKQAILGQETRSVTFKEYLGAYQKLLTRGNEFFAFWIDYANDHTLYFSKWKE